MYGSSLPEYTGDVIQTVREAGQSAVTVDDMLPNLEHNEPFLAGCAMFYNTYWLKFFSLMKTF